VGFVFICRRCGHRFRYDWHRGLLFFPAMILRDGKQVISFKCPYCNRRGMVVKCPKCGKRVSVSKAISHTLKNVRLSMGTYKLYKLYVKCPYCRYREHLDTWIVKNPKDIVIYA